MSIQVCDEPDDIGDVISERCQTQPSTLAQPAFWGGVFAMTLCIFALVASEFMPVGVLTPLAADLLVSEGHQHSVFTFLINLYLC